MTLQQLKDERVEQAKSKIYSELMLIIFYIVVASFCVKALYFHMDLKQCATEYIILILTPIYQAIRSRPNGRCPQYKVQPKGAAPHRCHHYSDGGTALDEQQRGSFHSTNDLRCALSRRICRTVSGGAGYLYPSGTQTGRKIGASV